MKKALILFVISIFLFEGVITAQNKIKGVVKDESNSPIKGAIITNKTRNIKTSTAANGEFEIEAIIKDIVSIECIGYTTNVITITDDKVNLAIQLSTKESLMNEVVVMGGSSSPKSYWIGATLAYNIDGAEIDNVVGSAKVGINPVSGEYLGASWGIVGNFANFISAQNKEKTEKDLLKVAQSSQGLSIGMAGTWEVFRHSNDFNLRCYVSTGYRLNAFQRVGKDSSSVSLSQFRNTAGIEFEGFRFNNGGKLHLSFEGSLTAFSENKYELVFGEKKSSLTSLEVTAILPIAGNIGFLANGTYAKQLTPVYQFGIVLKNLR